MCGVETGTPPETLNGGLCKNCGHQHKPRIGRFQCEACGAWVRPGDHVRQAPLKTNWQHVKISVVVIAVFLTVMVLIERWFL